MLALISAGIFAVPGMLLSALVAPIVAILSIPSLLCLIHRTKSSKIETPNHVIISGGSSGIGFAIAKECVKRGVSHVTLLARNLQTLEQAQSKLQDISESTIIHIRSVSVTDYAALEQAIVSLNISKEDRVVVWSCAGYARPGTFLDMPIQEFEKQVQTNQLGSLYLTRAILPHISRGCIVFTSSAAGQLGVYGYTSYAPTKFAVRGLAETLQAEMLRSHPKVALQVAFPVDTDTPGYQQELTTTPAITKKLTETAGLASAESTARAMVKQAFCSQPPFMVYFNFEGWMLSQVTAGMSPATTLHDAMAQVAGMGLLRWIGLFVLLDWKRIIQNHPAEEEESHPKSE